MCLRPSPCIRSESLATPSRERVLLWCIAAGSPLLFSPLETKAQSPLWPEPVATEVVEGNSGWTDIQWLPKLSSSPSVSRSVYYASVDGSAIAGMDYRPVEGVLVFPAGHNSPGLPSPQSSNDPDTQKVQLPDAFGIEMLADLTRPTALIASTGHEWLEDGLYVAQTFVHQSTRADHVYHISWDGGSISPLVELDAEADPTSLAIAPAGSPFGNGLYISSNNRDGHREGDWGGTIQRFDPIAGLVDWTGMGVPMGPGEPGGILFGLHGWAEGLLFLANSVGYPGDLISIHTGGELEVLWSDQWEENAGHNTSDEVHFGIDEVLQPGPGGKAFRTLAMPPEKSLFGDWLYIAEFDRGCHCIERWHPERGLEMWVENLPWPPHAMAFSPGGLMGNDLYVAVDLGNEGHILRIDPSGTITPFITGLQGFLYGNGKDVLQFSEDGNLLYLSDYYAHRVYRITHRERPLTLQIQGDAWKEPDETLTIEWKDPTDETPLSLIHI